MRQARAIPLPNEALNIEEIKFWLRAMQEHTNFIRAGLPAEAEDFLAASREFYRAFTSVMQKTEHLQSVKQAAGLIEEISGVMDEFQRYQQKLLSEKLCCKLGGGLFPFFLDHMLREARCFSDFILRLQSGESALKAISHTREIVVWLRFMADHTRLICHYIDPSERRIGKMAADFADLFDQLMLEGRDLASMLYCHKGEVRAFHRFLLDVRLDVQRLRDFNKMAEELVKGCRLLGILTGELAAHMRREAEHCLLMIALLEKEIIKHCPDAFHDDLDQSAWPAERVEEADAGERLGQADMLAPNMDDFREEKTGESAEAEESLAPLDAREGEPFYGEPVIAAFDPEPSGQETEYASARSDSDASAEPVALETPDLKPLRPEPPISELPEKAPPTAAAAPEPEQEESKPKPKRKEKLHAKASDYKYMPNKYAGKTPGERCKKKKSEPKLPRSLGKIRI